MVNVVVALDFLGRNFSAPGPGVLYAPINITVHSLVSGDKIYDAQTLFVALLLNVIKIFCLDLSPGCVCFETFDYLRMPHQRAFDPIF